MYNINNLLKITFQLQTLQESSDPPGNQNLAHSFRKSDVPKSTQYPQRYPLLS